MNLHIDLRLKNDGKAIRHFYIPVEIKLKETEPIKFDPVSQRFALSIQFVDAGIKGMKVYSLDPTKLETNEVMLIQSFIGIQLQQKIKEFKGRKFDRLSPTDFKGWGSIQNLANCFGAHISP